jgi:hypothetical protein
MIKIIEEIENFLLALCALSDNSFFKLFLTYAIFAILYTFLTTNIEKYLGFKNEVRLYDLIFIVCLFAMFAWNSYHLHIVKVNTGTPSFKIKKVVQE